MDNGKLEYHVLNEGQITRLEEIIDQTLILKSFQKPSEWYEANMVMPAGGPFPGPIRYDRTPYWREPVDCSDPNHPARDITIMGPAQMGKSIMVLNPIVGYSIALDPCNILFLTGHSDLTRGAMMKIEFMIQNTGLERLIMPSVLKAKNNRSGDTLLLKEFRGGDLKSGSVTNHNLMRQNTVKKSIADDLDAGKMSKEDTGDTVEKIKTRSKAHENDCKRYWVSTPQVKGRSLTEKQLLKSDRRNWMIECPKCGNSSKRIDLRMPFAVDEREMAGLTWKLDKIGHVEFKSVGYVCQLCANFFQDHGKHELLNSGIWIPTKEMDEIYHYGYEINGLYAPHGMTSWYTLASKNAILAPPGMPRDEKGWQTYWNDDVGCLYEPPTNTPMASDLMKKCRNYTSGIIPEALSEADGNGDIIMLTWAADCNGLLNDARIDWQIKAISRNGAKYAVDYGSMGTFIPNQSVEQKANTVREKWTYEMNRPNSVWQLVSEKLGQVFKTDTGRQMKISVSGIDVGYLTDNIYNYIDNCPFGIFALMGDKEHDMVIKHENIPNFKLAQSRHNLYTVNVNAIKDNIANRMRLPWNQKEDVSQPHEFMNFPNWPYTGTKENPNLGFFEHYESEERGENDKGYYGWKKKGPTSKNHQFDVEIYSDVIVDIYLWRLFKKGAKEEVFTWSYYAGHVPMRKK